MSWYDRRQKPHVYSTPSSPGAVHLAAAVGISSQPQDHSRVACKTKGAPFAWFVARRVAPLRWSISYPVIISAAMTNVSGVGVPVLASDAP